MTSLFYSFVIVLYCIVLCFWFYNSVVHYSIICSSNVLLFHGPIVLWYTWFDNFMVLFLISFFGSTVLCFVVLSIFASVGVQ